MVYLLKMVIFHGKLLNNQRVLIYIKQQVVKPLSCGFKKILIPESAFRSRPSHGHQAVGFLGCWPMKHGPKMAPVYDVSWSTFGSPPKNGGCNRCLWVYGYVLIATKNEPTQDWAWTPIPRFDSMQHASEEAATCPQNDENERRDDAVLCWRPLDSGDQLNGSQEKRRNKQVRNELEDIAGTQKLSCRTLLPSGNN